MIDQKEIFALAQELGNMRQIMQGITGSNRLLKRKW
jgi:hypothetical protein